MDEARKAISGLVSELLQESRKLNDSSDIELVTLDQAINRILAEDLLSPIDVPAADNSAMDGFAFHGEFFVFKVEKQTSPTKGACLV